MKDLVLIHWVDSSSTGKAWRSIEDFGPEASSPLQCQSVGWIMAESKKAFTLAMNIGYEEGKNPHSAGGDITIPRSAVLSIRKLTSTKKIKY
jgi:hypothetical protein